MKKILPKLSIFVIFLAFFIYLGFGIFKTNQVNAATEKVFTVQELAEFDGLDGRKSYTSYEGVVYDVTDSKLWKLGEHFGLRAGKDLTKDMEAAPHGDEVFAGFTVLGTLEGFGADEETVEAAGGDQMNESVTEPTDGDQINESATKVTKEPWYSKRIRIAGFSILGWTGIVLAIVFILTFGTCFALPWAKLPLPWKGRKIGPDPLDAAGTHLTWSSIHKYFVWITVIFGIIHGIIGFMQMIGIYL